MLVNLLSPHLGALACPFTPEMLQAKELTLILSPFTFFTFGLVVEFIKELGGASICQMLNFGSSFMILFYLVSAL